jgi:hypothetical protein
MRKFVGMRKARVLMEHLLIMIIVIAEEKKIDERDIMKE